MLRLQALEQKHQERLCVVCMEREKALALDGCGHMHTCAACGEGLEDCPVCRAPVLQRIQVCL